MSLQNLDKAKLKRILKTSQGFASESSKAMVRISNGQKLLTPSRTGHAVSKHVRGAAPTGVKTKFRSLDDMASALELLLKTRVGQQKLAQLTPGSRQAIEKVEISRLFPVEGVIAGIGTVTFTTRDLRAANIQKIKCTAVLECRARAGESYLHVQTFYPAVTPAELNRILDAKTAP